MNKMLRLTAVIALIFALACAGLASAELFAPHGEGQIGVGAVVASEEVAIYDKPSEDAKVVETLPFGHTLILMAMEDDWGYCALSDDVDGEPAGWVSTEGLIVDPCWFMTREETSAYADKDATSEVLARFDADMIMPVLKIEGDWIGVNANGKIGWINVPDAANTPDARFDADRIPEFLLSFKGDMSFHKGQTPVFTYKYKKDQSPAKAARQLLELSEDLVERMNVLLKKV